MVFFLKYAAIKLLTPPLNQHISSLAILTPFVFLNEMANCL
jgi:hypothetical protein